MSARGHTLGVARALFRASLAMAFQYRLEFLVEGALALLWVGVTLVPLWVVFGTRPEVAGWSFAEVLMVIGWFTALKGFLEGVVSPSLLGVVEHVRKGTLDFILVKPADPQLLVSLQRIEPWRLIDLASAIAIFSYGFHLLARTPTLGQIAASLVMLLAALVVLYAIAIAVISIAFFAVRVDNLLFLFQSLFDVARWPSSVFRGALSVVFTYVLPLALMTTYPALALLGKLTLSTALGALAGTAVFALFSRLVWRFSLRRYTSASS
jgi:ABC-2 type transport system permease protein